MSIEERMDSKGLERQLRIWREARGQKPVQPPVADKRTVQVNGQNIIVVKRSRNRTQG